MRTFSHYRGSGAIRFETERAKGAGSRRQNSCRELKCILRADKNAGENAYATVLVQYKDRLREMQAGAAAARFRTNASAIALFAGAALFLILGFSALRQQVSAWWVSIPVPVIAASARSYRRARESRYRSARLAAFCERALERINGAWAGTGVAGTEFAGADHPYATDLNVVGEGSLFELLCVARTSIGRRGLAGYLLQPAAPDETLARQEAVRELQQRTDIRERVALLGKFDFLESKWESFEGWLGSPRLSYPRYLPVIAMATSASIAVFILLGAIGLAPWLQVALWTLPIIALHSVFGLVYRKRVNRMHDLVRPVSVETEVLRQGLQILEETDFRSAKLKELSVRARKAPVILRKLERLLNALNERQKEWFYGPSLILLLGTQIAMAIERWRREHAESMRTWMSAWAEFEALSALATYAYENPANTFPEFVRDETLFEAAGMGHPLIPSASCVVNDIALNANTRFYVVSGSNMSGKSTLLRAIGLNAVLASAGAPVRAARLRFSRLSTFASISIVDSLLNGKSKFLEEVSRLRRMIEAAQDGRSVLFLVDEILSGTNSGDRRVATEAVIRTLVDRNTIGALSTHDLALCEIAELEGFRGMNVHMGAREGAGPLDFDYRLKPGITREKNALAIARMAGVSAG